MTDPHQAGFTIQSIGQMLLRHKKKIIVCPLIALALGVAVIVFCPRTYRSEAQLFLRIGRESVGLDPTATAGQTVPLQQFDRKDEIKSAIQLLKSRAIISKTVDDLGPEVVLGETGPGAIKPSALAETLKAPLVKLIALVKSIDPISEREEAIITMENSLNVEAERESMLIVVQYDADTPQLAQTVCDALIAIYQQEHMRIHRNEASRPFFAEQQRRLQTELDDSLLALQNAKNEMGLASVESRRETLESQFSAIELERLSTQQQLSAAAAHSAELEAQLAKVSERAVASQRSVPNAGADMLRDQLYALEVKSMDLKSRYSDSHPLVQTVNDQLEKAKQVLAQQTEQRLETSDDVNPIHRQLSLELKQEQGTLAGLKARAAELAEQKEAVLAGLRAINASELKLDQLARKSDLARDKYHQYSRSVEESFIDLELEKGNISNVSLIQPPTLAERPVSPSKSMVGLATVVLAVAGTCAVVLLSEQLNAPRHNEASAAHRVEDTASSERESAPARQNPLPKPANGRSQAAKVIDTWL